MFPQAPMQPPNPAMNVPPPPSGGMMPPTGGATPPPVVPHMDFGNMGGMSSQMGGPQMGGPQMGINNGPAQQANNISPFFNTPPPVHPMPMQGGGMQGGGMQGGPGSTMPLNNSMLNRPYFNPSMGFGNNTSQPNNNPINVTG